MRSKWNSKQGPWEMLMGGAPCGAMSHFSSVAHQVLFAQARGGWLVCLLSPSVCPFLIRRRVVVASGSFSPPGPPMVHMRISYQMAEWVTRPSTAGENGTFGVYPLNRTPRHTRGYFHQSLCEQWKGIQLPQSLRMSLRSSGMKRDSSEWSLFSSPGWRFPSGCSSCHSLGLPRQTEHCLLAAFFSSLPGLCLSIRWLFARQFKWFPTAYFKHLL